MAELFRETYPDEMHMLDGELLNRQHRVLNAVEVVATDGTNRQGATVLQQPQVIVGILQVTNDDNTCSISDSEYQNPCSSRNLYTARMQVWNHSTETWEEFDEDLRVDAACRFGTRQGLWKGERFSAYFDRQRNWFVPLSVPGAYHLVLDEELAASDGVTATAATATVKQRNNTTDAFEDATDADGSAIQVEVYSWYSSSVATDTRIMAVRDGFGDLWLAAVDC